MQSGLLELTEKLVNSSDATVQIISKAIIGHFITEHPDKVDSISLTDEEIVALLALLQLGRSNVPISDYTIANMLKSFMSNATNIEKFEHHKLTSSLEQKWNLSNINAIVTQLNSFSLDSSDAAENTQSQDAGSIGML